MQTAKDRLRHQTARLRCRITSGYHSGTERWKTLDALMNAFVVVEGAAPDESGDFNISIALLDPSAGDETDMAADSADGGGIAIHR